MTPVLIRAIAPARPAAPTIGFECLGLGPNGERFSQIVARTKNIDQGLVRIMLMEAAYQTAECLRSEIAPAHAGVHELIFTFNLDETVLRSPILPAFFSHERDWDATPYRFEIHEDMPVECINMIKDLVMEHSIRFVLDDREGLANEVYEELVRRAEFVKVSFKAAQEAMSEWWEKAGSVARKLKVHSGPKRPLLVEGIKTDAQIALLRKEWATLDLGTLYGQGRDLEPEYPWDGWLTSLKPFGLPGGHIIADPYLAEATRMLRGCLSDGEWETVSRRNEGKVFVITVPGKLLSRSEDVRFGVPHRGMAAEARTADVDHYVVGERIPELGERQIVLAELASYIRTWQRAHELGEELRHDDHERDYMGHEYVPSEVEPLDVEGKTLAPATDGRGFLTDWLFNSDVPFCALLGDYGSGKTFLCRMFTARLLEMRQESQSEDGNEEKGEPQQNIAVPLYLDMRYLPTWQEGRVPDLEDMLDVLKKPAGFEDISVRGILAAAKQGDILLIFDGFDEKAAHLTDAQAPDLLRHIRSAAPKGSKGRVIIACRTHYFIDRPNEQKKMRGGPAFGTRDGFHQNDFRIAYVKPFDDDRVRAYLGKVVGDHAHDAFEFLGRVHDLLGLAHRPYLLSLIAAQLGRLETIADTGQRVGAADIYEEVVEAWLERDEGKHLIFPDLKIKLMQELARRMWRQEATGTEAGVPAQDLRDWLMERLLKRIPLNAIEDLWRADADMRTATFLNRDAEGNFRFAHRSFMEFFLARSVARGLCDGDPNVLDLPQLTREVIEFAVDLLHRDRVDSAGGGQAIRETLESKYIARPSKNALLIKAHWDRIRPDSAPQPTAIHLEAGDLSGSDLSGARLDNVSFAGADLSRATLTGARLRGDMSRADLTEIQAGDAGPNADGPVADLEGVCLRGAMVDVANLAGAKLRGADLRYAVGRSVFLQRADLTDAKLAGAYLPCARLHGANVTHAQLQSVRLPHPSGPAGVLQDVQVAPQTGHGDWVRCPAFSPDGDQLATASYDKTAKAWDVATGQLLRTFEGHEDSVHGLAFSPDSDQLATGSSDSTAKVWDAATGQLLCTFKGHQGAVRSVAFSPDGTQLATASSDGTAKVWHAATGRLLRTNDGHEDWVNSVVFHPDGTQLATASSDSTAKVWEPVTGQLSRTLEGHEGPVYSVVFHPDGTQLATGSYDRAAKVWDAATGRLLCAFEEHEHRLVRAAFSPDGTQLATASRDKLAEVWDLTTGEPIGTREVGWAGAGDSDTNSRGKWQAIATLDGKVLIRNIETGEVLVTLMALDAEAWVAYTPHGHFHCSRAAMSRIGITHGLCSYPAEEFEAELRKPEVIRQRLREAGFGKD